LGSLCFGSRHQLRVLLFSDSVFHKPGGRFKPPRCSRLGFGNAAMRGWKAASVHHITESCLPTAKLYLKKHEPLFPFLPSDEEAIPGSPCYGALPLISSICLSMDSYNHFFFCQHYFKHKDFLCRCLPHQNNVRLQSDHQSAFASLG